MVEFEQLVASGWFPFATTQKKSTLKTTHPFLQAQLPHAARAPAQRSGAQASVFEMASLIAAPAENRALGATPVGLKENYGNHQLGLLELGRQQPHEFHPQWQDHASACFQRARGSNLPA